MVRSTFFLAWTCGMFLSGFVPGVAAETVLPEGPAPAPVVSGHFPDRVHEFVWRNWNAVEPAKMARLLGTSEENVCALAASLGLPPAAQVPPEMKIRGYITLLRRNWHLLPYDQLLELVEMTPERLAFSLREDDFLWIKLGSLKPKCAPLRYRAPDEAARRRAAEIRRVVEADFGAELRAPVQPRFDFVRQLGSPLPNVSPPASGGKERVSLRLVYSYLALYGDPLSNSELDPYPDGFLARLSAVGVNGVWLHAVLRDLAPGGAAFPEFGADCQKRLANLRVLVERAKKHGVGVYLYMNEPRAMPAAFFKNRPELAGVPEKEVTRLCTSHPAVRRWMGDALAHVFREVPGLAGIYAISASENPTNCASHGRWQSCARCKTRSDAEIIAEVIATLDEGVHRGNPQADVVVSDWGWKGHGDATDIIRRLPKSARLMSVSEWSLPIERGGVKTTVGEYAISAVGPGPRALRHWAVAREAGLKTAAEIQFNNTCEIASIPYLPVLNLVAEHCRNLAPLGLDGMLIGWTMGGHPSPNFQLAQRLNRADASSVDAVLDALARERFGPEGAPHARKAWKLTSDAFVEYPFHISVVYTCPVQWGPANPLYPARTDYKATMWGLPYDDLDGWRGPYPREVFAAQFEKMSALWRPGIAELQAAVEKTPADRRDEARTDLRFALAAGLHFQAVANQAYYVIARDALAKPPGALLPEERQRFQTEVRHRVESEIALARQLFTLVREDSRIGFEPSCQYFYLPLDLVEKVINCRWLLSKYDEVQSPSLPQEKLRKPGEIRTPSTDSSTPDGRQSTVRNSFGMTMVRIPAGEFMMGNSHRAEAEMTLLKQYGCNLKSESIAAEYPRHRVRITQPFYLGAHHVTVGQFRRFAEDSGYRTDAEKDAKGGYGFDGSWKCKPEFTWRHPGFAQTDDHPVVLVSWNDAVAFCRWLSGREGREYRLPTEAEWEYSCRAGTTTRYYCGDDPEDLARVANVGDAAAKAKFPDSSNGTIKASDGYVFTAPVGRFRANAFGLYDMVGNAWQWCADYYGIDHYAASTLDDPTGPGCGTSRVTRGGSWFPALQHNRSAARYGGSPDARYCDQGFRVVMTGQRSQPPKQSP